jgi:hypothetical protein
MKTFLKKWYSIILIISICVWVFFNLSNYKSNRLFNFDKAGYQLYLPATFIYKDLKEYNWYDSLVLKYNITNGQPYRYGLNLNTGYNINTYPIGTAILNLPFFLFADNWSKYTLQYPRDGFSWGYQLWASIASIIYTILGLIVIRKTLLPYYSNQIINYVLITIFFGTNLYNYTVFEPGMSHPISFFLYSIVLYSLTKLCYTNKFKYVVILGLFLGLSVITRNTSILLFIFILIYYLLNNQLSYTNKQRLLNCIFIFVFFLIGVSPQIIYTYHVTNHFFVNTYSGYTFNFNNPQLLNGLFSFRKGIFIYTPIILLPLIGIRYLFHDQNFKLYALSLIIFLLLFTYITFSWGMWYYGWGFGCRPFIEVFVLFAIPLAIFYKNILTKTKRIILFSHAIVLLIITLNLFQTWQYSCNILHGDRCNLKYYLRVFGKTYTTKQDRLLIDENMPMNSGGW